MRELHPAYCGLLRITESMPKRIEPCGNHLARGHRDLGARFTLSCSCARACPRSSISIWRRWRHRPWISESHEIVCLRTLLGPLRDGDAGVAVDRVVRLDGHGVRLVRTPHLPDVPNSQASISGLSLQAFLASALFMAYTSMFWRKARTVSMSPLRPAASSHTPFWPAPLTTRTFQPCSSTH